MLKKTIFLIALAAFTTFCMRAQNPCTVMIPTDSSAWGQGVIWVAKGTKLTVYNQAGEKSGVILRDTSLGQLRRETKNGENHQLTAKEVAWAGWSTVSLLKVYSQKDDRYRVLANETQDFIWITKADLEKVSGRYFDYSQVLFPNKQVDFPSELQDALANAKLGVNLINNCLNLRKAPSIESDILRCIESYNEETFAHTHFVIQEVKGDWARVEATFNAYTPELDETGDGCVFKVVRKQQGWFKAIGDDGYPNIWFSVTSY